jgi:hypothetical protein
MRVSGRGVRGNDGMAVMQGHVWSARGGTT